MPGPCFPPTPAPHHAYTPTYASDACRWDCKSKLLIVTTVSHPLFFSLYNYLFIYLFYFLRVVWGIVGEGGCEEGFEEKFIGP